jgi:hypothetical protein
LRKRKLPVLYHELKPRQRRRIREQYVEEQNGLCYYCGSSLMEKPSEKILNLNIDWTLFPKDFLKWPIHLQHNHQTGLTEGAVHSYCNAVMWQYEGK